MNIGVDTIAKGIPTTVPKTGHSQWQRRFCNQQKVITASEDHASNEANISMRMIEVSPATRAEPAVMSNKRTPGATRSHETRANAKRLPDTRPERDLWKSVLCELT